MQAGRLLQLQNIVVHSVSFAYAQVAIADNSGLTWCVYCQMPRVLQFSASQKYQWLSNKKTDLNTKLEVQEHPLTEAFIVE